MKKILFISFIFILIFLSCKKKETTKSGEKLYTFNSLKSDHDTILKGNTTNIRVDLSGTATCAWSASAGDIFGSGTSILFGASTCCVGYHTIKCTISDKNGNSEDHSVNVFVK